MIVPDKLMPAIADVCAQPPLSMSRAELKALDLTVHSLHGTYADMSRFAGPSAGFVDLDDRRLGHWLRDRAAAQDDPRPGQRGQAHGAMNSRDDMQRRYTQGSGRRGERQEQLRVREKLGHAVRDALQRFGRPWYEMPKGRADWDILLDA